MANMRRSVRVLGGAASPPSPCTVPHTSGGSLRKFALHVRAQSESSLAFISKAGSKVSKMALLRLMSADRRISRSLSDLGVSPRARLGGVCPHEGGVCPSGSGLCACKTPTSSRVSGEPQVTLDQLIATLSHLQSSSSKASEVGSFGPPLSTTSSSSDYATNVSLEGDRQPSMPDMDLEPEVEEETEEESTRPRGRSRRRKTFWRFCRRIARGLRTCCMSVALGGPVSAEEARSAIFGRTQDLPGAESWRNFVALPCYDCAVRHQESRGCPHTRHRPDVVHFSPEEAQSVLRMLTPGPAGGADERPPPYELHGFFSTDLGRHTTPTFQVPRSLIQLHALRHNLDLEAGIGCKSSFCCAAFSTFLALLFILWIAFL